MSADDRMVDLGSVVFVGAIYYREGKGTTEVTLVSKFSRHLKIN